MVIEKLKKYICPYCLDEYPTYGEADQCSQECAVQERDMPEEEDDEFICEYCNESYFKKHTAEECELQHIRNKDKYYYAQHKKINVLKLKKAANHKHQTKLIS